MTWFADLTPYTYHPMYEMEKIMNEDGYTDYKRKSTDTGYPVLNIGWLDKDHVFDTEIPSEAFIRQLKHLTENKVTHFFSGYHECHFCERKDPTNIGLWRAGNGSIIVNGKDRIRYAAPKLIYHYVLEHHYKPPQEFIDAVMVSDE